MFRSLAAAHLVNDLPRLGVDGGVVLGGLQLGEDLECAPRELGAEHQRLQARDDRVATEDGHEPGHSRRGQIAEPTAAVDAQRGEVGDRARERVGKVVPRGPELGHPELPSRERRLDSLPLLAEPPLGDTRHDHFAVEARDDLDVHIPGGTGLELDPVADLPRLLGVARLRQDHLRLRVPGVVLDHELVLGLLEADFGGRRQLRAGRVAEGEVVVLDREDVCEIVGELERQLERDRLHGVVVKDQPVLHPFPDEPVARDRDRVLLQLPGGRVPQEERRRVVLHLARREEQRALSVHGHGEQREEARVVREEPARRPAEVAVRIADAEVRAFEDRDRHQPSSRTMRVGLAWASALMTISSTFTCSGRVSAKTTHSAMSSGRQRLDSLVAASSPRSPSPRKRTMENSDSTSPGSTSVSRIGRPSRSSRRAYVKPRTANFDAT